MARGKVNGASGRYPFRRAGYRESVRCHEYADIGKSEYPTVLLWIVRVFGIPSFGIFCAARKIYPSGGNITKNERGRRREKLASFTITVSALLGTASYFALSFLMCHGAYKGAWQAFFLILLFLFFVGSSGMVGLLGLNLAYGGDGSLKRSPVKTILDSRGRFEISRKYEKREARYGMVKHDRFAKYAEKPMIEDIKSLILRVRNRFARKTADTVKERRPAGIRQEDERRTSSNGR